MKKLLLAISVSTLFVGCSQDSVEKKVRVDLAETPADLAEKSVDSEQVAYEGIQWHKNIDGVTFAEVKALAQAEGKAIFMDYYTKWCGPCKAMDKEVFPQKAIGDYYNAKFINFKVDAEEGEGIELAEHYDVQGYPTFVYTDADGVVLGEGTSAGYGGVEGMLSLAKVSLGEEQEKPWAWYEEKYQEGNRELAFLNAYAKAQLKEKRIPPSLQLRQEIFQATPEAQRFLDGSETYEMVLWSASPGNFFYEQLLANKDKYPQLFDDRIAKIHFVKRSLGSSSSFGGEVSDTAAIKADLARDFADVYELGEEAGRIEAMQFDGSGVDAYVKAYVEFSEKNDLPVSFDEIPFSMAVPRMDNLEPQYARMVLPIYESRVEEDSSHFFSVTVYCYLLYKSGDQQQAFDKAQQFASLTAQYDGNKKTARLHSVMKALEAKQEPPAVMQSR